MPLRSFRVTVQDMDGVSHTVEVTAASLYEAVAHGLGKTASEIRNRLGESLSTVHKFDTPLEQATTPSPEALQAFSSGVKVQTTTGDAEAIPLFKHAIELDPKFALVYARSSLASTSRGLITNYY